jgi:DNA-binding MarR family transcriptional regulator
MTTTTTKPLRRMILEALYVQPLAPRQLVARCDGYAYNTVVVQVGRLRDEGLIRQRPHERDLNGDRLDYQLTKKGRVVVEAAGAPCCPHCGGNL